MSKESLVHVTSHLRNEEKNRSTTLRSEKHNGNQSNKTLTHVGAGVTLNELLTFLLISLPH